MKEHPTDYLLKKISDHGRLLKRVEAAETRLDNAIEEMLITNPSIEWEGNMPVGVMFPWSILLEYRLARKELQALQADMAHVRRTGEGGTRE